MGPRGRFYPYLYHCDYIGLLGTGFMQVFQLGRAPRTNETLPDFLKVASGNPTSTCIPRVDGLIDPLPSDRKSAGNSTVTSQPSSFD